MYPADAIRIIYLRSRHNARAVLVDENLDLHSIDPIAALGSPRRFIHRRRSGYRTGCDPRAIGIGSN